MGPSDKTFENKNYSYNFNKLDIVQAYPYSSPLIYTIDL